MKYILILLLIIAYIPVSAGVYIDTVYSFTPGTVQFAGQSTEFFPKNIFGPPAKNATYRFPAANQEDVCSLGLDGEIVVGTTIGKVFNGIGPDFIIFENAFERQLDNKVFAEPAVISVSQNGIDFFEFPHNDYTLDGLAGKTPSNGSADPFDYLVSGGDAFDLADLGLGFVSYIKIKDVSRIVSLDESHPYYQPEFMVTGFDLDAIAIVYSSQTTDILDNINQLSPVDFKEYADYILIYSKEVFDLRVYNSIGVEISCLNRVSNANINKSLLPKGLSLIIISVDGVDIRYKILN